MEDRPALLSDHSPWLPISPNNILAHVIPTWCLLLARTRQTESYYLSITEREGQDQGINNVT